MKLRWWRFQSEPLQRRRLFAPTSFSCQDGLFGRPDSLVTTLTRESSGLLGRNSLQLSPQPLLFSFHTDSLLDMHLPVAFLHLMF